MKINGLGLTVYAAGKVDAIVDAYELYEASRSNDALIDVTTKVAELAAGLAIGFLADQVVGAFQKEGLDRVFDSMGPGFPDSDVPSAREYANNQKVIREVANYAGGKASDQLIDALRNYVSKHRALDTFFDRLTGWNVSGEVNGYFGKALSWTRPKDPLVLDLDNDGIEATAINTVKPVLFDMDADGIKSATGWIKSDDGILVLDLNANATIDSGRELFGDNTLLPNGVKADNGFQAIAQYDKNADGKIDASDPIFTRLRIWQDENQDGLSQPWELSNLASKSIASINVVGTASNIQLGNGNSQPWSGSFTRINGSTGKSGTPELSGSLLLASNNFFRTFADNPTPTDAAQALPQMGGSGVVRDLREAMSLGTPAAQALQSVVQDFAAATTHDEQKALILTLIDHWGDTSSMFEPTDRYGLGVDDPLEGLGSAAGAVQLFAIDEPELYQQIAALERFNGDMIFERFVHPHTRVYWEPSLRDWMYETTYSVDIGPAPVAAFLAQAWEQLEHSVYKALVEQTRIASYLDTIALAIDENGLRFDTTALADSLNSLHETDPRNALIDLAELNQYAQDTLQTVGFDGMGLLRGWIEALPTDSSLRAELASLHIFTGPAGSAVDDLFFGGNAADSFGGGLGDDVLDTAGGNDLLQGGAGNDTFIPGPGNDTVAGEFVNVVNGWYGGAGADTYVFGLGDGQDVIYDLDTTAGVVDRIVFKPGVAPGDVQATRIGDDLRLTIVATGDRLDVRYCFQGDGASGWAIEQVQFADGTVWSLADVKAMVLTGTPTNDELIGFESGDEIYGNAGGDTLDARGGADTLHGGDGADALYGGAGGDLLLGEAGNDNLHGGIGDDTLDGGAGNDLLAGDYANTVNGWYDGAGADTYLFGRGDGQDIVYDYDTTEGVVDSIVFKAGVLPADVQVKRSGDTLTLKIANTSDQIEVRNYFAADAQGGWAIEQIRFTDAPATVWRVADIKAKTLSGTAGNDNLLGATGPDEMHGAGGNDLIGGSYGNDTLYGDDGSDNLDGGWGDDLLSGGEGLDTLQGGGGNDTMNGGPGNDTLAGASANVFQGWFDGAGNDTYLFGLDGGQDRIFDVDATPGNLDRIVFESGVLPGDIRVARGTNDLYLSIDGTSDRLQVASYFAPTWGIEEIRFEDAPLVVWTQSHMLAALANGGVVPSQPPVLVEALGGQQATEDALFSFTLPDETFSDPERDALTYAATLADGTALPAWLAFDAATGTFSGTPRNGDVGAIDVKVTARDPSGANASSSFALTVANTNDAPVLAVPLPEYMATVGSALTIDIAANTFTDMDAGDVLGYSARLASGEALPPWLSFDANELKFKGTPSQGFAGKTLDIELVATDSAGATAPDTFGIAIGAAEVTGPPPPPPPPPPVPSLTLTGGAGRDSLIGGPGNDTLDGRAGADSMAGGAGDDIYFVDAADKFKVPDDKGKADKAHDTKSDTVTELSGQGWDTVHSTVSYELPDNVEALRLLGTAKLDGVGNAADNWITGNAGANTLYGGDGADVLLGGAGADTLVPGNGRAFVAGGPGNDSITLGPDATVLAFNRGDGMDTVTVPRDVKPSTPLVLSLGGGIQPEDVTLRKAGHDLVVDTGKGDSIQFAKWYAGDAAQAQLQLQLQFVGIATDAAWAMAWLAA